MGKTLRESSHIQKENLDFYEILKRTFKAFDIRDDFWSFGEFAEEAVCLVKNAASWVVYDGERGKKHNIKTYMNCQEACHDLISRIAESDDMEKKLKDFFDLECDKKRFSRLGYSDYKKSSSKSDIVPILGSDEIRERAVTAIH